MVEERVLILIAAMSPIFAFAVYMFISIFQDQLYNGIIRRMWRHDFKLKTPNKRMSPNTFLKDKLSGYFMSSYSYVDLKKKDYYYWKLHPHMGVMGAINRIIEMDERE